MFIEVILLGFGKQQITQHKILTTAKEKPPLMNEIMLRIDNRGILTGCTVMAIS